MKFIGFPCGNFSVEMGFNENRVVDTPDGRQIRASIGGRDDTFSNDLTGFFRSINYAPQFYHVPHTMPDARELPIPKTLLELDGNDLFNFRSEFPMWGVFNSRMAPHRNCRSLRPRHGCGTVTSSRKMPTAISALYTMAATAGQGQNCNAIILEIPHDFITVDTGKNRLVNAWGESWVARAAHKVQRINDAHPSLLEHPWKSFREREMDEELRVSSGGPYAVPAAKDAG